MAKVFKSMREFQRHYLPDDVEKYPIEMMVSKEEAELILSRREILKIKKGGEG